LPAAEAKIICPACQRGYVWDARLAGKQVTCKCGSVIDVPSSPPTSEATGDEVYDLAGQPEVAKEPANLPIAAVAATVPTHVAIPQSVAPDDEALPVPQAVLSYATGATPRRAALDSFIIPYHKGRDLYAPLVMLAAAGVLYAGCYAYRLSVSDAVVSGVRLVMTVCFQTALLSGFAVLMSRLLGVSFGRVGVAMLKFTAIVFFCDAVVTWIVGLIGGWRFGTFFYFAFGPIIVAAIYWPALLNLFEWDSGDSWNVILFFILFDFVLRMLLIALLPLAVLTGF